MTDNHALLAAARTELISISRRVLCEFELELARQIERAENAASARRPRDAARALKPLITNLRRLRAEVHRYTHKPIGILPDPEHPAQEAARLFAELAFCSQQTSRIIDRLSQLDEARSLMSWWKQ